MRGVRSEKQKIKKKIKKKNLRILYINAKLQPKKKELIFAE